MHIGRCPTLVDIVSLCKRVDHAVANGDTLLTGHADFTDGANKINNDFKVRLASLISKVTLGFTACEGLNKFYADIEKAIEHWNFDDFPHIKNGTARDAATTHAEHAEQLIGQWETHNNIIDACIQNAGPDFRYVLQEMKQDLEQLDPTIISAAKSLQS